MFQQSELMILVLFVAFAPLGLLVYRRIEDAGKRWLIFGMAAMLTAYTSTVVEGFLVPPVFNALEHASFAVAGACFAMASYTLFANRAGAAK